jgi:predicted dehydrogenase
MAILNAAVIGMGVGEKHALAYENHQNIYLKTVCDFDLGKLNNLKTKFPNVSMETNDQSILENEDIDIVSIASYDNFHSNQIIQALNNGKHVMSEKPLCLTLEEMIKIHAVHKQNKNLKLSANHVLRSNSRFKKFKKDINAGKFGDVFYLEGDYYWGRRQKLFGWRAEMKFYSIILGAAIHMIDLVMWLLGTRPVSVQAIGNDIFNKNTKLKFNSFAVILIKFENGVIAKITGNGGCVHPHYHGLKVFGTKRTAIHNLDGSAYLTSSELDSEPIPIDDPYPEKEARQKIIHSFVDSILDHTIAPIVTDSDVYDVMSVCFAAEEAMNTGNTVEVNYLT